MPFQNNLELPSLRFAEFADNLKTHTLEELCVLVTSGSRDWAKYYADSGDKFIRMTNLPRHGIDLVLDDIKFVEIPESNSEGKRTSLLPGDILVSITAELGKIGVVPEHLGTAYINQHTALIRLSKKNNPYYVAHLLSSPQYRKKLNRLNDSGAKAGLNLSSIKKFRVTLPRIEEQQKVSELLSVVDKKISLQKEKHALLEQYKKGVMQKLFKQDIRFKDDSGNEFPDWKRLGFGKVFERITRKNKEDNQNVLTISAQMGLVNQEKYFNKSVSAKDLTGYYLLENGDFAYNKSYSKGYPMGAIKRLNNYDKGVVSTLYICFRVVGEQEPLFWEQFFEAGLLNREINKIAQEGARNHGLLNVSVTEFFNDIEVPVPSRVEQRKIADFLRVLDQKLNAVKEQIELTQTFKKGLLQQMFV